MRIDPDFLAAIGATPLIRLRRVSEQSGCEILGKAEFMNPGGSVKDRAARAMVLDAERRGVLAAGGTVVEGTAGNTGIGLAHVCNARGYRCVIVMPDNQSPEKYALIEALGAEVRLDHVRFRYPSADEVSLASLESVAQLRHDPVADTLHEVSFTVPAGSMVALVGPSGAGKTTISQLVTRMYDPTEGSVSVAGLDLRDVTAASLRATVGVVSQEAHLFHDTIAGNLRFVRPDASDDDIEAALRQAQVWDLVHSLPEGIDTVVGDRGYRLSGGERQRLAIARLLLKAPAMVVLDEATAHLDSESEVAVQRALDAALAGRTSLVIAHRLSTVRDADLILVLESGRIVQRGTHAQLLAQGGLYADLYRTQFLPDVRPLPAAAGDD